MTTRVTFEVSVGKVRLNIITAAYKDGRKVQLIHGQSHRLSFLHPGIECYSACYFLFHGYHRFSLGGGG